MSRPFDIDPYSGKLKILFVGLAESTHTHSWIDLLDAAEMNVRLFALPGGLPPENWPVRVYVTNPAVTKANPGKRLRLYPRNRVVEYGVRGYKHFFPKTADRLFPERWLAQIIRRWRPDIIHTLGLDPAGLFYYKVRHGFSLAGIGKWVLQLRGGSDLALSHLDPEILPRIAQALQACDQLVSDNEQNFQFALKMGVTKGQIATLGIVPGTGGIDITALSESWHGYPSNRRDILWPKSYECPWSKALPILEAIKMVWHQIQPCHIHMLAMTPEVRMWYWTLPKQIQRCCHLSDRVPRSRVLELMTRSRLMLAPSLVDGTPNSLFEAMAAGAFPIVSPLETIRPLVEDKHNVLFARNLYPQEIAKALVRAMTDDVLVDRAADRNLELVRRIADRSKIGPRVVSYYQQFANKR